MCRVVGAVGAAEADSGIPEGRYSNPADDPKVPILATRTHTRESTWKKKKRKEKAAANISRRERAAAAAGRPGSLVSSRGANLPVIWGGRSHEVILDV